MKVIYAILAAAGWVWLAIVLLYLFVVHPRLQQRRMKQRGFEAVMKNEKQP